MRSKTRILILRGILIVSMLFSAVISCAEASKHEKSTNETASFIVNSDFFSKDFDKISASKIKGTKNSDKTNDTPVFPFQFHWIGVGGGTTFLVRQYSEGKLNTVDDEEYLKITLWLKVSKVGKFFFKNANSAIAYVSKGSSVWPRASCGSLAREGIIEIKSVSEKEIYAELDFYVDCVYPISNESIKVTLKRSFTFQAMEFSEVTPWFGKRGQTPLDEIRPN